MRRTISCMSLEKTRHYRAGKMAGSCVLIYDQYANLKGKISVRAGRGGLRPQEGASSKISLMHVYSNQ